MEKVKKSASPAPGGQKRNSHGKKAGFSICRIIVFLLLAIYAFTLIYAMVWAVLSSLKTQTEFSTNLIGLPRDWQFGNYLQAFRSVQAGGHNMLEMFFNSLWYSCGGALLGVIASSMVAYVVAKYEFPGRKLIYAVALVTMMIPVVGSFPSQYRMYSVLGILDSPLLLVTKFSGFGFNFVMLYSFFKTLSWTYAEAAFMDGASHLKVFLKVMLPQALPVMGSLFLVSTVQLWNEYMEPNLFLQSHPTLSSGLYVFQLEMTRGTNYPLLFAGLIVSVIPVIILFVKFQNTMMESMSMGGLKG